MKQDELIAPIPESEWPAGIAETLTGNVLNIHRIVAHSPQLLRHSAPLRNYLVNGSRLSERQRELLILRTAHLIGSEYEWAHHVIRGQAAGLSLAEIMQVRDGSAVSGWTEEEASLLELVDEMHASQQLSTGTQHRLQPILGNDGLIDAIFTVGFYLTLGTILKSFAVPLDENIQPLS